MEGKAWGTLNARWGKRVLSNKCGLPGDPDFPANSGQDLAVITSTTERSLHSSSQRDHQQSLFWCCKITCSPTKPKPGAQRTRGQEPSGGTDLLAPADSGQPHLLVHLTNHSTYRGAGTVTERPAGSRQMPLPIKLWGLLPKKGHVKMQSVHPTLMSRGLCERLGLMRAAHMGLLNNYLDFPLENHSPNSLLAAETSFPAECLFFFHDVKHIPQIPAKLCHSSLCPGESPHNVNVVSMSTLTFSVPCSWSQKTKGHSSKDPPSTLFPIHLIPAVFFRSLLYQSFLAAFLRSSSQPSDQCFSCFLEYFLTPSF